MQMLGPSESTYEVDSTSHYRESTTLQYPMSITMSYKYPCLCVRNPELLHSLTLDLIRCMNYPKTIRT